jgi:hypothetical protein
LLRRINPEVARVVANLHVMLAPFLQRHWPAFD